LRPSDLPPEALVAALALVALVAVLQSARLAFARWLPGHRLRVSRARGADGEVRAEPLLRGLGYAIVARQAPVSYDVSVDGAWRAIELRADFVVERDGRRFVAEVKTGRLAPRLDTSATRRQLLEYRIAFDVVGVLLVDVDAGRVHAVEFPLPVTRAAQPAGLAWLAWVCLGGALGFGAASLRREAPPRPPTHGALGLAVPRATPSPGRADRDPNARRPLRAGTGSAMPRNGVTR
jgi:hypothetical protein